MRFQHHFSCSRRHKFERASSICAASSRCGHLQQQSNSQLPKAILKLAYLTAVRHVMSSQIIGTDVCPGRDGRLRFHDPLQLAHCVSSDIRHQVDSLRNALAEPQPSRFTNLGSVRCTLPDHGQDRPSRHCTLQRQRWIHEQLCLRRAGRQQARSVDATLIEISIIPSLTPAF